MAKIQDVMLGKTMRKSFAKHDKVLAIPNMLKIQKDSYNWFLDEGLREVFRDVDTITDYTGNLELSFLDYSMNEPPKYTVEECKERDATFAKPIKVRVRLHNKETDEIKEQEIFMGDFPLMTNGGTFVINGAERVIVSQIVRSPGMYYGDEVDKADQHIYSATVIPYRGAWLEYETDLNNVFYVRIDKNRKIPITCLIRALGISRRSSARTRCSTRRWKRIPAVRARNRCLKSTASSVRANRPQSKARRAISTLCSSTHGATMFPRSDATSSTRRWTSGAVFPGRRLQSP